MEFEVDDLVWAKMKGYSAWPAKIADPPAIEKNKASNTKKQYVYFFGTNNHAWIPVDHIEHHSDSLLAARDKKKSALLQVAIDEIVEASKYVEKKTRPNQEPLAERTPKLGKAKRMSPAVSCAKNVTVNIKKSPLKKSKTPEKSKREMKRSSDEFEYGDCPSSKKAKSYNGSLYLKPNVAVIPPYESDSISCPPMASVSSADRYERPQMPHLDITKVSDTLVAKSKDVSDKKIGFLGLGAIGRGIVTTLINSGHKVTVWNRDGAKCEEFVQMGADCCSTPADVVRKCDVTFCCVSDSEAAKAVVFESNGVLKGLEGTQSGRKGYVEMTTIDPIISQEIGEAITYKGGRYLEAPVCGSRKLAEEGSLLVLVSGDFTLFNDIETCLYSMSKCAYYLSCDVGTGSKMNIVLNMLKGIMYAGLAEIISLVERLGISVKNFMDILSSGPLNCPMLIEKGEAMLEKNFDTNTALKHVQKDMKLSLKLGDMYDQPLQIAGAASEVYKNAMKLNFSDHDVSSVVLSQK